MSDDKSLVIFGRDVSKIPCFRNSFLYGISGGLGMGLAYFMFSSRPLMSTHFAMGSFTVITIGYWVQCRYKYSKVKFEMLRVQELLRTHATFEGTGREKELDAQLENEPVEV